MKRNAINGEIKGLSSLELKSKADSIAEELMKLRFRKVVGQLDKTHRIKALKRDLARVLTASAEVNRSGAALR